MTSISTLRWITRIHPPLLPLSSPLLLLSVLPRPTPNAWVPHPWRPHRQGWERTPSPASPCICDCFCRCRCLFSSQPIRKKCHPERSNSRTLRVTESKDLRLLLFLLLLLPLLRGVPTFVLLLSAFIPLITVTPSSHPHPKSALIRANPWSRCLKSLTSKPSSSPSSHPASSP
jgi:hypothetical protein